MDYGDKDIFNTAQNFEAAARAINEKLGQTNDVGTFIAPFITLSSFSIELYLKCLYMMENGKPAPYQHDLDKLFASLSEESRVVIGMLYNMAVQQDPLVQAMLGEVPGTKVDLDSVLKETSGAFKKWRYSYQKKLTGFPTSGPLTFALRGRIQILQPDWFNSHPS